MATMNLSHRLLQLGKTASNKIDQALPGFGLIGLLYLAADMELTAKGLGSPFHKQFWEQYANQLAHGDLYRASGTAFIVASTTTTALGYLGKYYESAKENSKVALGSLVAIGSGILFAAAVQSHDWFTAGGAAVLVVANSMLLEGTKKLGKIVDPTINFVKRRVVNFNTANVMSAGLILGSTPMFVDAIRKHDIGLGVVSALWTGASYLARRQMQNQQPAPNPSTAH